MKLSKQGLSTYIILLLGSGCILAISLLLYHQLLLASLHPKPAIGVFKKLDKLMKKLPTLSPEKQTKLIQNQRRRGLRLSLSASPRFKSLSGLTALPPNSWHRARGVRQFSLRIAPTRWLNVEIWPRAKPKHPRLKIC